MTSEQHLKEAERLALEGNMIQYPFNAETAKAKLLESIAHSLLVIARGAMR